MTLATDGNSDLIPIDDCVVTIPGGKPIVLNNLPDLSDSKSAVYNDEAIIGRAIPIKTYSHSENRIISTKLHFFIRKKADAKTNLNSLRLIQSAVYPQDPNNGAEYLPPPVCRIKCGELFSTDEGPLCVVLLSYNVTFPTDVAWDRETMCPYKFDVDCQWQVVYSTGDLPNSDRILKSGR